MVILQRRLMLSKKDEVGQLAEALRKMTTQLPAVIGNVAVSTSNVASGSEELSSASQAMAEGDAEQAASVEEVPSSIEEMSAKIMTNAENAQKRVVRLLLRLWEP